MNGFCFAAIYRIWAALGVAYIFVIALIHPMCASAGNGTHGVDAWHLIQRHYEMGDVDVEVTRDAARLRNEQYEISTIAPDWKIRCYNRRDKRMWIGQAKDFNGIVLRNPYAHAYQKVSPLTFVERTIHNGVMISVFKTDVGDKLACADALVVSPQVASFLCSYFFVPVIDKVPISYITAANVRGTAIPVRSQDKKFPWLDPDMGFKNDRGIGRVRLSTLKLEKISYKKDDFAAPTGYKQVQDIAQVSYSSDQKSQIEEFMGDLGTASGAELKSAPSSAASAKLRKQ